MAEDGGGRRIWTTSDALPAVRDGNNAGAVLGYSEEHGHGKVEVGARRVAPPAIVVGQVIVGRAEVGGSDENGGAAAEAPLRGVDTLELKTSTAAEAIVEKGRA
ncbi:hypothetical protein RJ639_017856 [Escallonia herrerae]|uniref:Uncharacterized protein n=1 Tax=Escallonia herrerae TaxID=1293975 RepID=A0AA89AK07_9ASTE|nr:hypothetical protein RJ639_017856 [Escallonia herrerae]